FIQRSQPSRPSPSPTRMRTLTTARTRCEADCVILDCSSRNDSLFDGRHRFGFRLNDPRPAQDWNKLTSRFGNVACCFARKALKDNLRSYGILTVDQSRPAVRAVRLQHPCFDVV